MDFEVIEGGKKDEEEKQITEISDDDFVCDDELAELIYRVHTDLVTQNATIMAATHEILTQKAKDAKKMQTLIKLTLGVLIFTIFYFGVAIGYAIFAK